MAARIPYPGFLDMWFATQEARLGQGFFHARIRAAAHALVKCLTDAGALTIGGHHPSLMCKRNEPSICLFWSDVSIYVCIDGDTLEVTWTTSITDDVPVFVSTDDHAALITTIQLCNGIFEIKK